MLSAPRLFIALLPDEAVREELAAWRDGWNWPRSASVVTAARLHLTLHFLGDVPLERVPSLAAPFTPFTLRVARAALWPHGIAVLEPDTVPDALAALQATLAGALSAAELTVDGRPYRPHLTLARRAKGAVVPEEKRYIDWTIDSYHLMSSAPGPKGGYTLLRSWP